MKMERFFVLYSKIKINKFILYFTRLIVGWLCRSYLRSKIKINKIYFVFYSLNRNFVPLKLISISKTQ